jgi:hypothetical protein
MHGYQPANTSKHDKARQSTAKHGKARQSKEFAAMRCYSGAQRGTGTLWKRCCSRHGMRGKYAATYGNNVQQQASSSAATQRTESQSRHSDDI